jgi:hypothetical protein
VGVGELCSAFARTGTSRTPTRVEPLPVEKGASKASKRRGGPRRRRSKVDAYRDRLGLVPDRVIADEAGLSMQAVRNRRLQLGIPSSRSAEGKARRAQAKVQSAASTPAASTPAAAAPMAAVAPVSAAGAQAWQVQVRDAAGARVAYVVAPTLVEAAARASKTGADVVGIQLAGPMLA